MKPLLLYMPQICSSLSKVSSCPLYYYFVIRTLTIKSSLLANFKDVWLILSVNLIGQCPDSVYNISGCVCMFLEEISIWTCRMRKEDWQCRWASSNPFRVWVEQEDGGRVNLLSLLELGHLSSPAIYYQYFCVSGLQSQTGTFSVSFPGFQPFGLRPNSPSDSHLGDGIISILEILDYQTFLPPW